MKKCLLFACLAGTIALTFVPLDAHAGRGEDETGPSQPATAATKPTPEALLADLETQETLCLQTIKETQSQLRHDAQAMNNDYDAWLYAPPQKSRREQCKQWINLHHTYREQTFQALQKAQQKRQNLGVKIQHQKNAASTALKRKEAFYEEGIAESRKKMKQATIERDAEHQQWNQNHRDASEQEKNAHLLTMDTKHLEALRWPMKEKEQVLAKIREKLCNPEPQPPRILAQKEAFHAQRVKEKEQDVRKAQRLRDATYKQWKQENPEARRPEKEAQKQLLDIQHIAPVQQELEKEKTHLRAARKARDQQRQEAFIALTEKEVSCLSDIQHMEHRMKRLSADMDKAYQDFLRAYPHASPDEKDDQTQALVQKYMGLERQAIEKTKKILHDTRAQKEEQNNQELDYLIEKEIFQLKKVEALYQNVEDMLPPPKASQGKNRGEGREEKGAHKNPNATQEEKTTQHRPFEALPSAQDTTERRQTYSKRGLDNLFNALKAEEKIWAEMQKQQLAFWALITAPKPE